MSGQDDTSDEAALKMKDTGDHSFAGSCDRNRVVGVLTDRDIVIRCVALGHDPQSAKVSDVMTRKLICCLYEGRRLLMSPRD